MTYIHHYASPLGGIKMASDGEALTGLWFDGQKYFAAGIGSETEEKNLPVFEQTDRWLDIYFQGKEPDVGTGSRRSSRRGLMPAIIICSKRNIRNI